LKRDANWLIRPIDFRIALVTNPQRRDVISERTTDAG
jgi:hypothetical protein